VTPPLSVVAMLAGLPVESRTRFQRLHARCVEMRGIAAGVRGAAGDQGASAEEIRTRSRIDCSVFPSTAAVQGGARIGFCNQ